MIDWGNLLANSLWIMGCALALAVLSFASWQASIYSERISVRMSNLGYKIAFALAGVLFCAGQFLLVEATYLRVLWVFLGFLLLAAVWFSLKNKDIRR